MSIKRALLAPLIFTGWLCCAAFAAPGDLDLSFGAGTGKVNTAVGPGDALGTSVAVQADGKVVVAGFAFNGSDNDVCLVRYNPDGTLDSTFGNTGRVMFGIGTGDDAAYAIALQSDGKIVVAGSAIIGSFADFAVARLKADGSLDPTFNSVGYVTTTLSASDDIARGVVLQSDGKIVVAGFASNGAGSDVALVRYLSDGTLDLSFNTSGQVITSIPGYDSTANAIALQGDGRIVAAGYTFDSSTKDFVVLRYGASGTLDPAFNTAGYAITAIGSSDDVAYGVAVQPDGKIVAGGYAQITGTYQIALVRYDSLGSLDTTFNTTGKVTTPFAGQDAIGYGLALQGSSKIVVAGYASNGTNADFVAARYLSDGTLDPSFDGDGRVQTPIGPADDIAFALAIQSDSQIVLGGSTVTGANSHIGVVRYLGNLPPSAVSLAATNITGAQADLNGKVNPSGDNTLVHFDYGTDPSFVSFQSTSDMAIGGGLSDVPVTLTVGSLSPNTTYYFRVTATNSLGTRYGAILSFATLPLAPAVTTLAASSVTATTAVLHGRVNPGGVTTAGHFLLGTASNLAGASPSADQPLGSGVTDMALDQSVFGLLPFTKYYYQATASNAGGVANGTILSFMTSAAAPTVTLNPASFVGARSAVFSGSVNPNGTNTQAHFDYSSDPSFATFSSTSTVDLGFGQSAVAIGHALSELSSGQTFYVRLVATNFGGTTTSDFISFTTSPPLGDVWDLADDWSDSANPNGVWAYTAGATPLDSFYGWSPGNFPGSQHVWSNGSNGFPVCLKASEDLSDPGEVQPGDVLTYPSGPSSVTWTSPIDGVVKVQGSIWATRGTGLGSVWSITLNGAALTGGSISRGEVAGTVATSRTSPMAFSAGSGGVDALNDIVVSQGDVIALTISALGGGDFAGVSLSILGGKRVTSTDPDAPGRPDGTTFVEFGSPTIDGGSVGGAVTYSVGKLKQTVIYGGSRSDVLVRTGDPQADGTTFLSLGDPLIAKDSLGFFASAVVPPSSALPRTFRERAALGPLQPLQAALVGKKLAGLFSQLSRPTGIHRLATIGSPVSGIGTSLKRIPNFGLPRRRPGLIFTGNVGHGNGVSSANDFGVWREKSTGGDSDLLLQNGKPVNAADNSSPTIDKLELNIPVDNANDQRRSFGPDGSVMVAATFGDKSSGVVEVAADGTKTIPFSSKDSVPDIANVVIVKINAPATAGTGGAFALRATLAAQLHGGTPPPSQAIFARRGGQIRKVVALNESVPGQSGDRFAAFGHPLMGQGGMLGLIATLKRQVGAPPPAHPLPISRKALVQAVGNVVRVVAQVGGDAAGTEPGSVYLKLGSAVVTDTPQGQIVFTATLRGPQISKTNNLGMWSVSAAGDVRLILRSDQLLKVGTTTPHIRMFYALDAKPAARGQGRSTDEIGYVTAKVTLSDRRTGIVKVPLP